MWKGVSDWTAAVAEPTAKQQLLPSVRGRQALDRRQATSHGSTQVSRVAECPHRQAVQVNRLHQVRQQCPLEAQHAPPVRENECRFVRLTVFIHRTELNATKATRGHCFCSVPVTSVVVKTAQNREPDIIKTREYRD